MGTLVLKSNPLRLYNVYLAGYAGEDVYFGELTRTPDDDSDLDPEVPDDIKHEGRLAVALGRDHAADKRSPESLENAIQLLNLRVLQDRKVLALYRSQPPTSAPAD